MRGGVQLWKGEGLGAVISLFIFFVSMPAAFSISEDELFRITVGTEILLTNDKFSQYQPVWSPDGTMIAYQSTQSGNPDIWVMNADGSEQTQLTFEDTWDHDSEWSPDGKKIAYVSEVAGNRDIWIMDIDGSNKKQLTTSISQDMEPAFSHDGEWIAYTTDITGNLDIWMMKSDGTGHTQVTSEPISERYPTWGREDICHCNLLFISDEHLKGQIWSVTPFKPSKPVMITTYPYEVDHPTLHPGGELIAFTDAQLKETDLSTTGISIQDYRYNTKLVLTSIDFTQQSPDFSPDGTKLVYITNKNGGFTDIAVIDLYPKDLLEVEIETLEETLPPTEAPVPELYESESDEPTSPPSTSIKSQYIIWGAAFAIVFAIIFSLFGRKEKTEKIIEREKVVLREIEEVLPTNCLGCGGKFKGKSGDECEFCGEIVKAEKKVKNIE